MTPNALIAEQQLLEADMRGIEAVRIATASEPSGHEIAHKLNQMQVSLREESQSTRHRPTLTVFLEGSDTSTEAAERVKAVLELTPENGWYGP